MVEMKKKMMVIYMTKSYKELIRLNSFEDRFNYLKLNGEVAFMTFGSHRYLNQMLYASNEWKSIRRLVIDRDGGFDLAHKDHPIYDRIYIHHINPITIDDILERKECVFDLNNLISTTFDTHNAIHYSSTYPYVELKERTINDTCPWR